MVLFSGFLYDTATLPPYLAWLPRVSIVSYAFSSLVRWTHSSARTYTRHNVQLLKPRRANTHVPNHHHHR